MKFTVSFLLAFLFAATAYSQDKLRTLLPTRIYAATGLEANIYFDNLVLTPDCSNYIFDVTCSKGRQDSTRWYMNPKDTDLGSVPFELTILNDENKKLASAKSEIVIVSKDAGKGRAFSILVVGDSLTDASVYPNELKKLLAENGNPEVTFIGSHSGRGQAVNGNRVSHEGRGGWKWSDFCTVYDLSKSDYKAKSPFLFPDEKGKPVLDFKKYLDKYNNGKAPDFITVFLGTNDVFGVNDDASIDKKIDEIFKYADILIAEFRKTAPLCKIGLVTTIPPVASQDAFGNNYKCGQTRWQFRRNQHRLVERLYEKFGNSEKDNISIIPAYVNVDCENNYPVINTTVNERSKKAFARPSNGVHPANEGYFQIADTLFSWIKYKLSKNN